MTKHGMSRLPALPPTVFFFQNFNDLTKSPDIMICCLCHWTVISLSSVRRPAGVLQPGRALRRRPPVRLQCHQPDVVHAGQCQVLVLADAEGRAALLQTSQVLHLLAEDVLGDRPSRTTPDLASGGRFGLAACLGAVGEHQRQSGSQHGRRTAA